MEGIFFYWIAWMVWVYSTFMIKKSRFRLMVSIIVLVIIIVSPYSIHLGIFEINVTIIAFLIICSALLVKKTTIQKVYLLVCTLTITIAYVSFLLFELFDPVWLFIDRKWMLAIILVYLASMLIKERKIRVACVVLGTSQGELLYGFILSHFRFEYVIGSMSYLDITAITSAVIVLWLGVENLAQYFDLYFNKTSKEKQG